MKYFEVNDVQDGFLFTNDITFMSLNLITFTRGLFIPQKEAQPVWNFYKL